MKKKRRGESGAVRMVHGGMGGVEAEWRWWWMKEEEEDDDEEEKRKLGEGGGRGRGEKWRNE